jgi:hypothetical protein
MTSPVGLAAVVRAEAVFASGLPTGSAPSNVEVSSAIGQALRVHGGSKGCAIVLAGAYGECPETAAPRMRWALALVRAT